MGAARPPTHLPALRLRLLRRPRPSPRPLPPRALKVSPAPASTLAPRKPPWRTSCVSSPLRGVGSTPLREGAGLPVPRGQNFRKSRKTLCLVESRGSRLQEREARSWTVGVTPGPVPAPGVMVSPSGRAGGTPVGGESPEISPGKGTGGAPRGGWSGREPWDEPPGRTHLPGSAGAPGPPRKPLSPAQPRVLPRSTEPQPEWSWPIHSVRRVAPALTLPSWWFQVVPAVTLPGWPPPPLLSCRAVAGTSHLRNALSIVSGGHHGSPGRG